MITLIWLVDETLGFQEHALGSIMLPELILNFLLSTMDRFRKRLRTTITPTT